MTPMRPGTIHDQFCRAGPAGVNGHLLIDQNGVRHINPGDVLVGVLGE